MGSHKGGNSMSHKRAWLAGFFCSCVFSTCSLLYGQASGSFSGTVVDTTGSVVSGATVKVTSQGTGISREAKTDDTGHYLIPLLPVAYYTIRIEAPGFQAAEQKDVRLQVDEHRELDFTLVPASVSSTVEVSATEVAVETTNPTLGQVITSEQVAELPLNGRDFVQLATLIPGVTQETNPNSFFNAGPSSEVSTHGTLFEFFRNTKLDSKNFFAVTKDKFNLNQFGGSLGGALQKDKTFFFADYQATRKRRGVPGNGLVPTAAMVTGDYTLDPLGLARPGLFNGSTNADGFGDINSPYTFSPFQCDVSGNPLPAGAGGVQPAGVNCNKIPSNMFDPAVNPSVDPSGLAMINLYPKANVVNTSTLTNF